MPATQTQAAEACMVCGAGDQLQVLAIDEFRLYSCRACGLKSLLPRVSKDGGDYSAALEMDAYVDYMKPMRTRQYRDELRAIRELRPSARLLDIGCALGWFVREANATGFTADGLEPQADLAKLAALENPSSEIFSCDVAALPEVGKTYEVVTLWSAVEHFPDPERAIREIGAVLADEGILALRTPNSRGLAERASVMLYKLSGGRIRGPLDAILQLGFESKHWWLFSASNLTKLLHKNGFDVERVYYSTSVDWRNIETWLKSRKMRPSRPVVLAMKLFFFVNEQLGRLGLADDFVLMAKKRPAASTAPA